MRLSDAQQWYPTTTRGQHVEVPTLSLLLVATTVLVPAVMLAILVLASYLEDRLLRRR
jgi:hypothetical protein